MEAIISSDTIKEYRELADTISDIKAIDPFILEAQNIELRDFLGDALFNVLIANQDDGGIYQTLIDGEDYTYNTHTVTYDGLKPLLCYIACARMLSQHGIKITRFGVVRKHSDESEHADDGSVARFITKLRATAKVYEGRAKQYLDTKRLVYTLWGASESSEMRSSIKVTMITNDN